MEDNASADGLQTPRVSEPEYLLFCPTEYGDQWLRHTMNNIPRYLFRVSTPNPGSETSKSWARSRDARHGEPNAKIDIFARDIGTTAPSLPNELPEPAGSGAEWEQDLAHGTLEG
ncbi:hypothetical protein HRG_006813 [Hirsutella rhossiliensis]|uniref:Uncharacterized protein n=1 Tax=Hirsutella rhossiliensis TaxID=111463 RepID=A0A9P8MTH8_9HYPO|nr:uncharacterized protein HRG_06813 [Hirsutella rhossiliensis]KAH0961733.1 hypothetical protein HRG_06813 [Hirsutella rhossiliensis]